MVTMLLIVISAILGLIGAMTLYNFFIFLLLRVRLYLYYVLYLFFVMLGIIGMGGGLAPPISIPTADGWAMKRSRSFLQFPTH